MAAKKRGSETVEVDLDALLAVLNSAAVALHHPCAHDGSSGWSCGGFGAHVARLWASVPNDDAGSQA